MDQYHFLIHGSMHGITEDSTVHFQRFERAGGRVEMLHGSHDAIVTYDGAGDQIVIESLIYLLERAGESADSTYGVITFGWSHQEPSHLRVGTEKAKTTPLWDALKSLHLKSWLAAGRLAKTLCGHPQSD